MYYMIGIACDKAENIYNDQVSPTKMVSALFKVLKNSISELENP